ncbi:MAG: NAD(P)/FAD-dependent oxidoreductase [Pseudomonadota bacterium]
MLGKRSCHAGPLATNESHRSVRHRSAMRFRSRTRCGRPPWHDRFPSMEFPDLNPDAFASKTEITDYFEAYAEQIAAPVRCGVEVIAVERNIGRPGFHVETSAGDLKANSIVAATGPFQRPIIPDLIPKCAELLQIHSNAYRNPEQLPTGAVMVIGAGSSGTQIADELLRSGRRVYLSVGPHDRPPRSYRGRDFVWWLGVLGKWDAQATPGKEHVTIAVSGADGGRTVDFRRLADDGMTLVGMTTTFKDGVLSFAPDLADNLLKGDANYLSLLDEADSWVVRNGVDLPEEPEARKICPNADCVTRPILELDLVKAGVSSIIWATGYALDYSWLKVDVFDENGRPKHLRGITSEPGVYFLGLPWLSRRGSSFIWGVWHDAKYLAEHILTQRTYLDYRPSSKRFTETA